MPRPRPLNAASLAKPPRIAVKPTAQDTSAPGAAANDNLAEAVNVDQRPSSAPSPSRAMSTHVAPAPAAPVPTTRARNGAKAGAKSQSPTPEIKASAVKTTTRTPKRDGSSGKDVSGKDVSGKDVSGINATVEAAAIANHKDGKQDGNTSGAVAVPENDSEPSASESNAGTFAGGGAALASEFDRLFREWKRSGDERLRERLILMNRNLVSYIARKFIDRGEMSEDIIQQGLIGLINALDHFDPNRGVRFATFATPTIMGEIRRYFRDKTWGIRVPRRLQELNQTVNHKIESLTQELDRSPTYGEIARALGLQIEEVVEALEMVHAMDPLSIDEESAWSSEQAPTSVGDQIGAADSALEGWGAYEVLQAAMEQLPEKERQVLQMAYFEEWSQVEIARHMQVSQMFISRLQRRALANLRDLMSGSE